MSDSKLYKFRNSVQLNFTSTFGTIKISSRQGLFDKMSVNHSARSGWIIGIYLDFLKHEGILCIRIKIASLRRF